MTNYKYAIKVNREQSEIIQKIAFYKGFYWVSSRNEVVKHINNNFLGFELGPTPTLNTFTDDNPKDDIIKISFDEALTMIITNPTIDKLKCEGSRITFNFDDETAKLGGLNIDFKNVSKIYHKLLEVRKFKKVNDIQCKPEKKGT